MSPMKKLPPCYLCGGSTTVLQNKLRHGESRNVYQCVVRRCGLVFLAPVRANLREFYRAEYRKEHSPVLGKAISPEEMFRIRAQFQGKRVAEIKKYLRKDARLLEIGCSTGHFLHSVKSFVKECVGIEFNQAHAAFARRSLGFTVFETPIEETPLPHRHFDLICLFQVFEHLEDPLTFLKSVRPYLKPSGRIVIEVPNTEDALLSFYGIPEYKDFYFHRAHLFYYSPKTLQNMMRRAGFRGIVRGFQQYNLLNHLHWLYTGQPQASAEIGMGVPSLALGTRYLRAERALNAFIRAQNAEYQRLLKKHLLSDSILFIGTARR